MIWKGVLGGVAVLVAISVAMSLFKLAVIAAVLGGIGYVGYKAVGGGGGKELPSGKEPRQLTSEIDRRMDELDKLDKKLDEQLAAMDKDRNKDRNKA